ncbi:unnamed protein product [Adineta steineri]|uniref:NAD(P)(+)--arginine ADP-ribosyltransferase n=2 Tax=Adineta steineri TaxID=433720 RepID=A0A814VLN5_9BILA|nr:unnamed protein product [Adineta steineri]
MYLFSNENSYYRQWIQHYQKVKGVFTDIETMYNAMQHNVRQLNYNLTPISIISSSTSINPNELDQSFMYSQLLKEIILDMPYTNDAKAELISFARSHYAENNAQLKIIDEFEQKYEPSTAIWWYTRDCFLHWMLNKALRTQNNEMIMKMGFFLHDLHDKIQHLYLTASSNNIKTVFRGQGVRQDEFDKIKRSKGGLFSFNNFLSTSFDSQVGHLYADSARQNSQLVGILFYIEIDRTISSAPFASVEDFSYFADAESEILFSMHTVFRIVEVTEIEDRLWQVNLALTNDNDPVLIHVMECIRNTITGNTPLHCLGNLMWYMGQYNTAEGIYEQVLNTNTNTNINQREICNTNIRLCYINIVKNNHEKAFLYYQKLYSICPEALLFSDDIICQIFTNTTVTDDSEQKQLALGYRLLEAEEKASPSNHPRLVFIYCSFGVMFQSMKNYSTALSFYEKSLEISQKCLPCSHPSLAIVYNNIGSIYHIVEEYLRALSYYEKTLQIAHRSFPCDHPDWAPFYHNIGLLYDTTGKYSLALMYYEKELNIHHIILPFNVSIVIKIYIKIGLIYYNMEAYSTSILSLKKGLEIAQTCLSISDVSVTTIYNEIAIIYQSTKEYSTALSYHEKALEILQRLLPSDHDKLAIIYSSIAAVYQLMKEYSTSLLFYKKALEIKCKLLAPDHIELTVIYNNIATVYQLMKQYSSAHLHYEKVLEICQKKLPFSYSIMYTTYINNGLLYMIRRKYSLAQSCFKNGLEAAQNSLSPTHPTLAMIYHNNGIQFLLMGQYSTALLHCEKALDICQKSRSSNYPFLESIYMNIGLAYYLLGEYSRARSYFEKTIEMHHLSISSNHPSKYVNSDELINTLQLLISFNRLQAPLGKILIRISLAMKKATHTLSSFMENRIDSSVNRINIAIDAPILIPMFDRELVM